MGTLLSLRDILTRDVGGAIQTGDAIFWDGSKFVASNPDNEISHSDLLPASLDADDHDHYLNIDGRTGGQIANGGLLTGQTLTLRDNIVDTNGVVISDLFAPENAGMGLGDSGSEWGDLYMTGQAFGMRIENNVLAGVGGINDQADVTTVGRIWYETGTEFLYVDTGGVAKKVGHNTYNSTHTNVQLQSPINVSASVDDARNCIWQLCDIANNEEIMAVPIQKTATTVTIANTVDLPVGSGYRLIGIEV